MKNLYLMFVMVMIIAVANGQGTNCNNAITIISKPTCIYQSYQTPANSNVMWFSFVAESINVNISVITTKFGVNAPHIHQLALGGGTCSNIVLIAEDELPFEDDADRLSIDLNASGLIVGQTYFIRVKREATDTCDKVSCRANNSSDPTAFNLCVENVNVIIPLDFGLELPDISHAYHQNRGQLIDLNGNPRPDIKQYTIGGNPAVYLTDTSISYVFTKNDRDSTTLDSLHRVDMTLEGANSGTRVFKTEQISGMTNYFLAHVPKGITRNKGFSRAVVNDVYPNIDMQFYSNSEGVKYYFIVRPGGNANDIVMKFSGATAVNVTADSSKLEIITSIGTLDFEAGHAYQINPGNQIVPMPWQAKFIKTAYNKVKLDIRNYPQNMPLFIQIDRGHKLPASSGAANNDWSTYLGKNYADGFDIVADDNDSVYVTGTIELNNLPVTVGAFQTYNKGGNDIFIGKFKDAVPQWLTFYGDTTGNEIGYSIDVRGNDVYIAGTSSSIFFPCFPLNDPQDGTHLQYNNPGNPAMGFIIRLNSSNGFPTWATFFGGVTNPTYIYSIAIAKTGIPNVFITGTTLGRQQFPLKQSYDSTAYFQTTYNGMGTNKYTSFIAAFNPDNHLLWNTLFGGSADETAWDIAVKGNDVYIVGETHLDNGSILSAPCLALNDSLFPLCNGNNNSYIQQFSTYSNENSFIARFSQSGQLKWSTLFGGKSEDIATGIAINSNGDAYITGYTFSALIANNFCSVPTNNGFPLCNPIQDSSTSNGVTNADIFIAKFNSNNQLAFSTFYGGVNDETGIAFPQWDNFLSPKIAIDWNNNVFITGYTEFKQNADPYDFPTKPFSSFYYQDTGATTYQAQDAFIIGINSSDQLVWATLYSGLGSDQSRGISTFKAERLYINGSTQGPNFPTACPAPTSTGSPYCLLSPQSLNTYSFIARFNISSLPVGFDETKKLMNDFLVYPNPANNNLNISGFFNSNKKLSVCLYNSIGQMVIQKSFQPTDKNIYSFSLSGLNDGIYLVQIQSGENIFSKKIIKMYK